MGLFFFFLSWLTSYVKGWSLRYSPGRGYPQHYAVTLHVGQRSQREHWCLLSSLVAFSHFPRYPQAKWALLVLIPVWVGLCTFWDPMGLSNELSCDAGSFFRCRLKTQGVFNQWFEALFPHAGALELRSLFRSAFVPPVLSARECGTAGSASHHLAGSSSSSLPDSCSLDHPAPQSTTSLVPPATILPGVLSTKLRISSPPTRLDECFCFISLVVGLPYSLIFCQFWLFFVIKLLLSFFWLCKEARCVYLHLHLGWKSQY